MQSMIRATETLKIPYKFEQNRVRTDSQKQEKEMFFKFVPSLMSESPMIILKAWQLNLVSSIQHSVLYGILQVAFKQVHKSPAKLCFLLLISYCT